MDISHLKDEIDASLKDYKTYQPCSNPRAEFANALRASGLRFKGDIAEGTLQRIQDDKDKGSDRSAWYVYHEFEDRYNDGHVIGVASYGAWRSGDVHHWMSRAIESMKPEERADFKRRREEADRARKAEEVKIQKETAVKCTGVLNQSALTNKHEYLNAKEIEAISIYAFQDMLIIPMHDADGNLWNIQRIWPDGKKRFMRGGKIKGLSHTIYGDDSRIYITEGFATGASVNLATGNMVVCAFTWHNLYEVAQQVRNRYPDAEIVIAGDNDSHLENNVGRNAANDAADAIGCVARFPDCSGSDWNDLHCEQGLAAVKDQIEKSYKAYKKKEKSDSKCPDHLFNPTGFIGDVVRYYRMTDKRQNDLLAIPTALTLASLLTARNFETTTRNRTSLFMLMVSSTGSGKEHCDKVIKGILRNRDMQHLASISGYKSGTAVFCALLDQPRHLCIDNEFGRKLEATLSNNASSHEMQTVSQLLEVSTKLDGVASPPGYATRNLKESEKDSLRQEVVNPALSLLGTTTPDFWGLVNDNTIRSGFLNRFIITVVNDDIKPLKFREPIDVPESILIWIDKVKSRLGERAEIASEEPDTIKLPISDAGLNLFADYDLENITRMNGELQNSVLREMMPRCAEMAMRVALVKALSDDPYAEMVNDEHVQWGIDWVRYNHDIAMRNIRHNMSNSGTEKMRMDFLESFRKAGDEGILKGALSSKKPFSAAKKRDREELVQDLIDGGYIEAVSRKIEGRRGAPPIYYVAIEKES